MARDGRRWGTRTLRLLEMTSGAFLSEKRAGPPADGVAFAEDHELVRVLGDLVAATVDLGEEAVHADEALDVARLATDDTALLDGFRGEEILQPDFGGEGRVAVLHPGRVEL